MNEGGQAGADTAFTQLREHQRDVFVLPGQVAADAQAPVEGLIDESGGLRLIRHRETGVEIGFEREFPEQREAEGVNRAHGNVAGAVAQLGPARRTDVSAGRSVPATSRRSVPASRPQPSG